MKLIIVKVINTFKHDSRAFIEQKLINSLVGLCRINTAGFEVYIHADLADKFVAWLNDNNPQMSGNINGKRWEVMTLDDDALSDFKESDNLCSLVIGRTKIGYVNGSEHQAFYQNLLTQVFDSSFLKRK